MKEKVYSQGEPPCGVEDCRGECGCCATTAFARLFGSYQGRTQFAPTVVAGAVRDGPFAGARWQRPPSLSLRRHLPLGGEKRETHYRSIKALFPISPSGEMSGPCSSAYGGTTADREGGPVKWLRPLQMPVPCARRRRVVPLESVLFSFMRLPFSILMETFTK